VVRAEAQAGRRVIVTGGPGEVDLARTVVREAGADRRALRTGTTLLEAAALVANAGRVVVGDTGVAHLATAFGIPSVVVFGPTSPALWGPPPERRQHRALWAGRPGDPHAPDPDPGLLAVSADDVVAAVGEVTGSSVPLPRELQIEVTASCNLRCRMCLVRYREPIDRHEGSLPFERFRQIVDSVPGLATITLQGLGEPLLAPDLFRMIAHAAARGVRVGFNTNATLLTRATSARLVEAGLDWLCISIDGATAATYESIRDGARFDRVERNVRALVEVLRERQAVRPRVSIVFVAMRRNLHELPALVRRAAEWGIATVRVQNLSHSFDDTDPAGAYREIRELAAAEALWRSPNPEAARVFSEAAREAEALGVTLRLPRLDPPVRPRPAGVPGCDWPWRSAYVRHDGRVQPCCMLMGDDRGILGDTADGGFARVWGSGPYEALRAGLMSATPPTVCAGCSMYRGVF
jgi:MoaA/NifB/PqqE/SkfB family radical SAM enzyme